MDWKKLIVISALLTATSALQAGNSCNYDNNCCYQPSCCDFGGFTISGEYLYWNARVPQLDYAVNYDANNSEFPSNSVKRICPEYDSGFRIGLEKECDCWVYGASYTWYRNSQFRDYIDTADANIAGTRIIDDLTVVSQGEDIVYASADWKLDYDYVNLYVAYDSCYSDCVDARLFGGFTFAFVDQRLISQYSDSSDLDGTGTDWDKVTEKINMDSYGLSFGIAPTYHWNQCFELFGVFSYDTLLTRTDRYFLYQTTVTGGSTITDAADLRAEDCWNLVGVLNLSVGVTYIWNNCWCDQDVAISLGYEFHNWFNTLGYLDLQDESGEITFDRYLNGLGFDGLFVKVAASF
ncbi:MAG: hypothetical protein H7A37_04445 [Chlamydiales bacterium]|nr:hypothetical protein [Chlamydiia bacterium]MCP5507533.1 hypothetical protein [Chlamydiales bacterium]